MPHIRCNRCNKIINQQNFNQQVRIHKLSITQLQQIFPSNANILCDNCGGKIPYKDWRIFVPKYVKLAKKKIICKNCREVMDEKIFLKEIRIRKWSLSSPPQDRNLNCKNCNQLIPYGFWKDKFIDYLRYKENCKRCPSCRKKFTFRRFHNAIQKNNLKITRMQKFCMSEAKFECHHCLNLIPQSIWKLFIDRYEAMKKQNQECNE